MVFWCQAYTFRNSPITYKNIAEDEQDYTMLESLELAHKASLLELQEAQDQFQEEAQEEAREPSGIESNTPPKDDFVTEKSQDGPLWSGEGSVGDTATDDFVYSIREEIKSLRSSRSGSYSFNSTHIQEQVVRHSERLSELLYHDQTRISGRRPQTLSDSRASLS